MALLFLITLASFVLVDNDLRAALLPNNHAHHASLLKPWLSDGDLVSFTDHQHRVDLYPLSCGALEFFDRDQVSLRDAVLFPSGLDDSIHTNPAFSSRD